MTINIAGKSLLDYYKVLNSNFSEINCETITNYEYVCELVQELIFHIGDLIEINAINELDEPDKMYTIVFTEEEISLLTDMNVIYFELLHKRDQELENFMVHSFAKSDKYDFIYESDDEDLIAIEQFNNSIRGSKVLRR